MLNCSDGRSYLSKVDTLPETNMSTLKMVLSNAGISFSRGPPFSGALAVSFREGI